MSRKALCTFTIWLVLVGVLSGLIWEGTEHPLAAMNLILYLCGTMISLMLCAALWCAADGICSILRKRLWKEQE